MKASGTLYASSEQKIYLTSEILFPATKLPDLHRAQIIMQLNNTIKNKRQVRLLHYNSSNFNGTTNRFVDSTSFTDDFSNLNIDETQGQKIKPF